ncbi:hypothetical protein BCM14_1621 [Jezberella montanilacus]|uniref:Uncharacterized protein n=1 Tax=Jezberella montanilacus TaxID=323426 RepID=A0A2T0XG30_9BURK|nr:hypothetical protein BCM14_1621 [Jezberella montanilacus]
MLLSLVESKLSVTLLSARYCSLLQASDVLLLASVEQRRFCLPMGVRLKTLTGNPHRFNRGEK